MRINKFLATNTNLSRRTADEAITAGLVTINGALATLGSDVQESDLVCLDGQAVTAAAGHTVLLLNKPVGYVCSRRGQGNKTIYDLLPEKFRRLSPVGRLDKDSSGLLLMTDDGDLAYQLTHPKFIKEKVYRVIIDKPLSPASQKQIEDGVVLEDGLSKLQIALTQRDRRGWEVRMHEGRNRQIRRTFTALGLTVTKLHRIQLGDYILGDLHIGKCKVS